MQSTNSEYGSHTWLYVTSLHFHSTSSQTYSIGLKADCGSHLEYSELIDYVYMDINNLIIYLILNKTILLLRCLHELLLE